LRNKAKARQKAERGGLVGGRMSFLADFGRVLLTILTKCHTGMAGVTFFLLGMVFAIRLAGEVNG